LNAFEVFDVLNAYEINSLAFNNMPGADNDRSTPEYKDQ